MDQNNNRTFKGSLNYTEQCAEFSYVGQFDYFWIPIQSNSTIEVNSNILSTALIRVKSDSVRMVI